MRQDDSPSIAALRRELDGIDHGDVGPPTQQNFIEGLRATHEHSITFLEYGDGERGLHAYNGVMYALDLCGLPTELMKLEAQVNQLDIHSEFVSRLVTSLLEPVTDAEAADGDVAFYFKDSVPEHAGLLTQDGFVMSKWKLGHRWRHPVFEVPSSFGDEVRFFRRPARHDIIQTFTAVARRMILERASPPNVH